MNCTNMPRSQRTLAALPLLTRAVAIISLTAVAAVASAQTTERVSIKTDGTQANGNSTAPAISADGRFVAFVTAASNLWSIPNGSESSTPDIYIYDRTGNVCDRVSWPGTFQQSFPFGPFSANGSSAAPSVFRSTGAIRVVFDTLNDRIDNIFCPDGNDLRDVYLGDAGGSTIFSTDPASGGCLELGNDASSNSFICADGTRVFFQSLATNFDANDTNNASDIFYRDVGGNNNSVRISIGGNFLTGIVQANGASFKPCANTDGTIVVFESEATNLISTDANGARDIYCRSFAGLLASTTRVSVSNSEAEANNDSVNASCSADGNIVAFESLATNLVPGLSVPGRRHIYVRNRSAGTTTRISLAFDGDQANGNSFAPSVSGNGRFVAFSSDATDLVPFDSNGLRDVFVRDLASNFTRRVSIASSTAQGTGGASDAPAINAAGTVIAFQSAATNLVAIDTNSDTDIFARVLPGIPSTDLCTDAVSIGIGTFSVSTVGAWPDGQTTCGDSLRSPDVWYTFTPPAGAYYKFETTAANYDTVLSLHDGCPGTIADTIACNDDLVIGNTLSRVTALLVEGETVLLRVSGFHEDSGTATLTVTIVPAPNDNCANAIDYATLVDPVTRRTSTVGANDDGNSSCGNSTISRDVWFKATAHCNGAFSFTVLFNDFPAVMSAHTGCPGTVANQLACWQFPLDNQSLRFDLTLSAGQQVFLRIAGQNGASGFCGIDINKSVQDNDLCSNATPLSGAASVPFNTCASFLGNTPDESCGGDPSGPFTTDLWYRWTAAASGSTHISACPVGPAGGDPRLALYASGVCPSAPGTALVCVNDGGCASSPLGAGTTIIAVAGQQYLIRVGAQNGAVGDGVLSIEPPTNPCPADFNNDGNVDPDDLSDFITCFFLDVQFPGTCPAADFNADGFRDPDDLSDFITAFFTSSC